MADLFFGFRTDTEIAWASDREPAPAALGEVILQDGRYLTCVGIDARRLADEERDPGAQQLRWDITKFYRPATEDEVKATTSLKWMIRF